MSRFSEHFSEVPVIGVLRGIEESKLNSAMQSAYDAGMRILEITLNTTGGLELMRQAIGGFGDKMTIGLGTVLNLKEAITAIQSGAEFIVSPNCNDEIAAYCLARDISYIPGALTPSEINHAWQVSREVVKVFPASVFGPSYIKSLKRGPFNDVKMLVTGGVNIDNLEEYLAAGACGVAIGSGTVYKSEWVKANNWTEITQLLSRYVEVLKSLK